MFKPGLCTRSRFSVSIDAHVTKAALESTTAALPGATLPDCNVLFCLRTRAGNLAGASDSMRTSRLTEPAAPDGRAGPQPGSARHAGRDPRRGGGTDLGRAQSMPLGGSPGGGGGGGALAERRGSANDAAGNVAGDATSSAGIPQLKTAPPV